MSTQSAGTPHQGRHLVALIAAAAIAVPWVACRLMGVELPDGTVALLSGLGILGAAFLLSWAVEVAELDVPQAVAVSVLALVAVLPEYAVDATFAWKAAYDPTQAGYAIANMTGGNRLLLGLGWSVLVFLAWARFKQKEITLPTSAGLDVAVLFAASFYALVPVARGHLSLVDTAVMGAFYIFYVIGAARGASEESEGEDHLVGPAALLGMLRPNARRLGVVLLFVWAAGAIGLCAEPFAESLVHTGLQLGIDEFLLVQWVAPLASEAPEFVVASLLVLRAQQSKGMMTLVSSKVNQWTLLVGTLPLVTSISAGMPSPLPFDTRQQEEVLLTAAQSIFGVVILADLSFTRAQAILLASLFLLQMAIPGTTGRFVFAIAYLIGAVIILIARPKARQGLASSFQIAWRAVRGIKG